MRVLAGDSEPDLVEAVELLRSGGLVAIPTETVYGLAADAFDPEAVAAVFSVKGRPYVDPLIVHVRDIGRAGCVALVGEAARALARRFWPGPLTMVLPALPSVPGIVRAGLPTVAVRSPAHPVMRRLFSLWPEAALAAPSANRFGYLSPTRAAHVVEGLDAGVHAVIDGGSCGHGIESTIVGVEPDGLRLLRPGPIDGAALCLATGLPLKGPGPRSAQPVAPGMMARHYSPSKPLDLFSGASPGGGAPGDAEVFLARPPRPGPGVYWLSEDGNLAEVARNLFHLLRVLDRDPAIRMIRMEIPGGEGVLAVAIRDRLERAAAR